MKTSAEKQLLTCHARLASLSAGTENLDALLEQVIEALLTLVQADSGSILVFSPREKKLRLYLSVRHPGTPSVRVVSMGEGVSGMVFETGKSIRVENWQQVPPQLRQVARDRTGSFLSLPLKISRNIIGVMNLNRGPDKPGFSLKDQKSLDSLLVQVASIVEKGRLLEEVRRRNLEIESLYALTNLLFSGGDFSRTLHHFLKKLAKQLSLERSAIVRLAAEVSAPDESFQILASFRLSPADLQRIIESVQDRLRQALEAGAGDEPMFTLPYDEVGKEMDLFCLPLPGEAATKHILLVSRRKDLRNPQAAEDHYRFLELVSKQLCMAFERHELLDALKQDRELLAENAEQSSVFLGISKELTSTLDPHMVLHKAFEQFGRLIPFSSIAIFMFNDLENAYQMVIQPYAPLSKAYLKNVKTSILKTAKDFPLDPPLRHAEKILTTVSPPQNPEYKMISRLSEAVTVPIVIGEKVMGIIHLVNRDDIRFGKREQDMVYQFTAIFIISIKNALVHRHTERLAYTDPLTSLYNHRFFQETLQKELMRAVRYSKPLSLMIMDIDHFKKFNDTHGHLIGDLVLRHVARIFENSVREKIDTVARYGGEEFAVILPETTAEGALKFGERIRSKVESTPIASEKGLLHVTLSIGIASTAHIASTKNSDIIEVADKALYVAKEAGRNQVKVYQPPHAQE
jgi:diguanylate cyclase (GGDEF)-like protein